MGGCVSDSYKGVCGTVDVWVPASTIPMMPHQQGNWLLSRLIQHSVELLPSLVEQHSNLGVAVGPHSAAQEEQMCGVCPGCLS